MLFPYTYVPHQMEKMHEFIDFIFFEVWCRAPKAGSYGLNLFDANPPLKEVMTSFACDDNKAGDLFSSQVQAIYQSFSQLSPGDIDQLKQWYKSNNSIEEVCSNSQNVQIARYADIDIVNEELSSRLASFFKNLYSQSLLGAAALRAKIGSIDDHYNTFVRTNNAGKCPFCGVNDLLGINHYNRREAYDHYLPKAIYPFNSINFKNLVPACHHCNSSYKTSKDPAYTPKDPARAVQRRAVFYPYTAIPYIIELQVALQHSDIANLTPADIDLQFGPAILSEKIDTWKDVYGIEERYKAKLCGDNDGKYWLTQVLDEWQEDGRHSADYLAILARQTQNRPYAECNFLKKPFLDACQKLGLF